MKTIQLGNFIIWFLNSDNLYESKICILYVHLQFHLLITDISLQITDL